MINTFSGDYKITTEIIINYIFRPLQLNACIVYVYR